MSERDQDNRATAALMNQAAQQLRQTTAALDDALHQLALARGRCAALAELYQTFDNATWFHVNDEVYLAILEAVQDHCRPLAASDGAQ